MDSTHKPYKGRKAVPEYWVRIISEIWRDGTLDMLPYYFPPGHKFSKTEQKIISALFTDPALKFEGTWSTIGAARVILNRKFAFYCFYTSHSRITRREIYSHPVFDHVRHLRPKWYYG